MRLGIQAFGEDIVARDLIRIGERVTDASPAFAEIAELFYASETEQFESEGSWASGGWPALAQSTLDQKEREGWDMRILHRTLKLRESLTEPGSEGSVLEITPTEMFIGSDVDYGKYHQQAEYRSDWLPMRKPVELPEAIKVEMVRVLHTFVMTGTLRTGFLG